MKIRNPEDVGRILDILFDEPETIPDMNLVSHIVVSSTTPISLVQDLVYVLWTASEEPETFDSLVRSL